MANFFQSDLWWKFQADLGEQIVSGSGEGWHYYARVMKDQIGPYLYVPYGPVAENVQALEAAVAHATEEGKKIGAYRLVAEPALPITNEEAATVFDRERFRIQPTRTQVVDLTQSEEDVIKGMNATRRKQHRGAGRKNITFFESKERADFELMLDLLKKSGEEKEFEVRDENYFTLMYDTLAPSETGRVFVGQFEGETQVVAYVIDDEDTRYYLYVGRDLTNNSLQVSSPMISYMILDAKSRGLKKFDLFGISSSDEVEDEMTGFTKFKRTFGGETVQYAGTWEAPISKSKHLLRKTIDKLERFRS